MKCSSKRGSKSLITLLVAGVVLALASCGKTGDRFSSQTYRLPWPDAAGEIRLQNVEVRTLSDPEHFEGSTARILVEPGDGNGQLMGSNPVGRYVVTKDGPIIPADYLTLQAVTVYAHQERLHDLDQKAGAADLISWPLSLGVDVAIISQRGMVKNNAIYDAHLNSLLLVPYSAGHLPITLSPGILGHEHFHFIFQKVVLSRVKDPSTQTSCSGAVPAQAPKPTPVAPPAVVSADLTPCSRLLDDAMRSACVKTAESMPKQVFNSYLLRAMNEGFADFWGWLYSQDDFFIAKSLPSELRARRLDWGGGQLPSEQIDRETLVDFEHPDKILDDEGRVRNAYAMGTQYARFLRQTVKDLMSANGMSLDDARFAVARALIAALPAMSDVVAENYDTAYMSPNMILKPLILSLPKMSGVFCTRLSGFHASESLYEKPRACVSLEAAGIAGAATSATPAPSPAPKPSPTPARAVVRAVPKSAPVLKPVVKPAPRGGAAI